MARKLAFAVILRKVSNVLHKFTKPNKLIKIRKRNKGLKRLSHYYYFAFSPSATPLILPKPAKYFHANSPFCSLYLCSANFSKLRGAEPLPVPVPVPVPVPASEIDDLLGSGDDNDDISESVDEKAERFIQRFYQEMRMQRRESI